MPHSQNKRTIVSGLELQLSQELRTLGLNLLTILLVFKDNVVEQFQLIVKKEPFNIPITSVPKYYSFGITKYIFPQIFTFINGLVIIYYLRLILPICCTLFQKCLWGFFTDREKGKVGVYIVKLNFLSVNVRLRISLGDKCSVGSKFVIWYWLSSIVEQKANRPSLFFLSRSIGKVTHWESD